MTPSRLAELGAIAGRILPDGRELCVIRRFYNTILTIGSVNDIGHDDSW